MKLRRPCQKCGCSLSLTKSVNVRLVFGIHTGKKPVFSRVSYPWCGRCRAVHDGKWRYAK